jgi:ubiquinone/menaquinone biosynthesis C-methylase UbiE
MDQHDLAARQFGGTAAQYLTSTVHATGADLDRLEALVPAIGAGRALDLGCGAGHASYALARGGARRVIAYDLSLQMLGTVATEAASRSHANIETCEGPAENLPFDDDSFDCVVTRYSAHHWLNVRQALTEARRVLAPGGTLVVIDVIAPENPLMDTVLQTVELLRDLSHVRDYRESEWRAMLSAERFAAPTIDRWKLSIDFPSWIARIRTPPVRVAALHTVFEVLPTEARDYFSVDPCNSFAIDAGWFESKKC